MYQHVNLLVGPRLGMIGLGRKPPNQHLVTTQAPTSYSFIIIIIIIIIIPPKQKTASANSKLNSRNR